MAGIQIKLFVVLLCSISLITIDAIDVKYCKKNKDYPVKVSGVEITPYPIERGKDTTFTLSAFADTPIIGGDLEIDVSYYFFDVYEETSDLCTKTKCPVAVGDFAISHSQSLPSVTPPGSYTLKMKLKDAAENELTCVTFDFSIGWAHPSSNLGKPEFKAAPPDIHVWSMSILIKKWASWSSGAVMREAERFRNRVPSLPVINPPQADEKCCEEMKGIRSRFLGKPKMVSPITTVKQGLVFQANTFDQYFTTPTIASDIKDEENRRALVSLEDPEKNVLVSGKTGNHLLEFEEKCPPGGSDSVILYTTSLRGIRKTFEDCNTIRFLLESFRVLYDERDVSMHMEFREELWRTLGGRVIPPKLFIKGRHVGGVDEVVGLHEQGELQNLVDGIPRSPASGPCKGCGGMRFVLCFSCNGSRKVVSEEVADGDFPFPVSCVDCNENGLVKCPVCF
ncbi:hypothetical protein OSB04_009468 [Centaurea solstitialis]|uniref:MD-2-related lipid-recognition domain-containing protein n=1 Tax=Centaurea solstitialis TaxID=347529 RepID=A0AA38WM60_9ASTR|nr:hypothetical protein OSB04_009468 [Centaurea solstitialis]